MAELCEVCWKPLKYWIDIPNYEEDICSECRDKIDEKFNGDWVKAEKFIKKLKSKKAHLLPITDFGIVR